MDSEKFAANIDRSIDSAVEWLNANFSAQFRFISDLVDIVVSTLQTALLFPPALVVIMAIAIVSFRISGWKTAIFSLLGLLFCYFMKLWEPTMETMALIIVGTFIALAVALPLGVLSARSKLLSKAIRPLMDFMQTMPAYVYLIPAAALLGIGKSTAILAMAIIALAPPLRLTNLGISQVPREYVELGRSFGTKRRQLLFKIQVPSALPTIMAGVNQSLMFALSMAVIAGIVGAGGLGVIVYKAIMLLEIGKAFDSGLAIVIMAIIMDRTIQDSVKLLHKGSLKK
jgi:glycine betaine/proline transport system permease protein